MVRTASATIAWGLALGPLYLFAGAGKVIMTDLIAPAAAKLGRLHARFEAEMAKPGSRADALIRGRIRYLQILARRVCADAGIPEPDWANDPLGQRP